MRALLQRIIATVAFGITTVGAAFGAVLPQTRIDAALAVAHLHRKTIPTSVQFPYYQLGTSETEGYVDPDTLDYGYLANGADLLIVPLDSGGSGGVFTTALFTKLHATPPQYVGTVGSADGHLAVYLQGGRIIVQTPVYGPSDANCCPSGQHFVRYTLADGKLKKLDSYDTGHAPAPAPAPATTTPR